MCGNVRGPADQEAVLHDRQGDPEDVDFLEGVGAHQVRADLAGDRDHRHAVQERIGDAGDEVGRARARRRDADAGPAGDPPVSVGGERRALLVADQDVGQVRSDQRIVDRHDRAAGIAEDVLHALALERFHDQSRAADGLRLGRWRGLGGDAAHGYAACECGWQAAFVSGLVCSQAMWVRRRAPTFSIGWARSASYIAW